MLTFFHDASNKAARSSYLFIYLGLKESQWAFRISRLYFSDVLHPVWLRELFTERSIFTSQIVVHNLLHSPP